MTTDFATWAQGIRRLAGALDALGPIAAGLGVEPMAGRDWHELLVRKLLPQLEGRPLLVVAVVGGTNIGKSVLFNHLTGEEASAASPLAAGTRHPVCLVPRDAAEPEVLARLFEGFALRPWRSADDPLEDSPEHRLFWRVGKNVPERLLLLDTPDIDSDAQVNWQRARVIRQVADVLVAVLTQQKYNDAAVKRFFREAARADKPIVVVFNQCDLTADRPFWPQWLATFASETDARPELAYVVPLDRRAADEERLPFFRVGPDGRLPPEPTDGLRDELGSLAFDAIKIRTLRGALAQVIDPRDGVGGYLAAVRAASDQFAAAARALSATEMVRVQWPTLPAAVLVDEIRAWWDAGRAEWSRKIHGFYRRLGQGVTWPVRAAMAGLAPDRPDPIASLRRQERAAIVLAVEKVLDELDRLSQVGNETLRPRLLTLLSGDARQTLLAKVELAHESLATVDDDYRAVVRAELDAWREANPRAVRFLQSLDHAAALARPAITVGLAVSGWVVAGDLVGQAAVQAAGHTVSELAAEAAIAGGIAGGGEALVSTTSEGVRQAAGRLFSRLQSRYAQRRAQWLAAWLEGELLGNLLAELRAGAETPQSEAFQAVEAAVEALRRHD
ncbi:MAG: 50S ribosome-binding GTPase [Pirellulales bacterium]|nr:50S ribosome-binding GTPase [Pirellulales bacterium]